MQDKYNLADFLDDLTDAFMPMRHVDEESRGRWTAVVHRKLNTYSSATLRRAVDDLISNRKSRGYPSIGEMLEACAKAMRFVDAYKPRDLEFDGIEQVKGLVAKWDAGEKIARDLILATKPQIAKKAAKENWIGCLWASVRRNGHLPRDRQEVERCQREAKDFDEAYVACVRGGFPNAAKLEELGASMINKREELRKDVLGKGA